MVKYYIGNDDESDDEDDTTKEEPSNESASINPKETDKGSDQMDEPPMKPDKKDVQEEVKNNPWTQMANSIQTEDLKSFQGVKRSLAKALLGSGNANGFEVANQMLQCWISADYNLPRLKILVSKTKNENLFPPKDATAAGKNDSVNSIKRKPYHQKKKPYLSETLTERLLKSKPKALSDDDIEFCVRKTIFYILIGTEGSVQGRSRFDDWKALNETTGSGKKKNQRKPNVPTSEIVYNYLPPGLREEEATNETLTQTSITSSSTTDNNSLLKAKENPTLNTDNTTEGI